MPGTVLKTSQAWTPEASQHQKVEAISLCPGKLSLEKLSHMLMGMQQ